MEGGEGEGRGGGEKEWEGGWRVRGRGRGGGGGEEGGMLAFGSNVPKGVEKATSAASLPMPIRTRPSRYAWRVASNSHQRRSRYASKTAWKSGGTRPYA